MLQRSLAVQGVGYPPVTFAVMGYLNIADAVIPVVPSLRSTPYVWAITISPSVDLIIPISFIQDITSLWTDLRVVSSKACFSIPHSIVIAMTDFYIKEGDTLPRLESFLKYSDGRVINLSDATLVQLKYRPKESGSVIIKVGTVLDATQGKVGYQWVAGDTTTPGDYLAEWQVTFPGGGQLTIPNNGYVEFKISPNLS